MSTISDVCCFGARQSRVQPVAEPASAAHQAFGDAVARRRREIGLPIADLLSRTGISRSFLHEIERGTGNLSLAAIIALASALEMAPSELVRAIDGVTER